MIMKPYGLNELREMFLRFFETKGHLRLPSFSLIPQDDASDHSHAVGACSPDPPNTRLQKRHDPLRRVAISFF